MNPKTLISKKRLFSLSFCLTLLPLLLDLEFFDLRAQAYSYLPRSIKPGSSSQWVFITKGEIHSIRHNKGTIEIPIPQKGKQAVHGEEDLSLSISFARRMKRFLERDSKFLLRDQDGRDTALFQCTRVERRQDRGQSLLLHGYFQSHSSSENRTLFVGFRPVFINKRQATFLQKGQESRGFFLIKEEQSL